MPRRKRAASAPPERPEVMADGPDPTATGGAGDEPASADGELVGLSGEPTSCMCGVGAVGELGQGVGKGAGSLLGSGQKVH